MWKERMHPKVSNAEIEVFTELSKLNLTRGMVTQKTITLLKPDGTKIETIPDFMWSLKRKIVYLDGDQIHKGWRIDRDNEIMELLSDNDWQGLRIPYRAPLRGGTVEFHIMIDLIKEFLGESDE